MVAQPADGLWASSSAVAVGAQTATATVAQTAAQRAATAGESIANPPVGVARKDRLAGRGGTATLRRLGHASQAESWASLMVDGAAALSSRGLDSRR